MGAVGLRSALAILIAVTGVSLAQGPANAETAKPAEREAPDGAESAARAAAPRRVEQRRKRRELRAQQGEARMAHARAVLFEGIELSAEQSREVDAIIEAELERGERIEELRADLDIARQQGDKERIRANRAERSALLKQRKGPDACMEEMRAVLTDAQRPTFDMNRARLAAESQRGDEEQHRRRPRVGAGIDAESGIPQAVESPSAQR